MDIVYTKQATEYKGNEFPEGKYRLDGIGKVGTKVDPEIVTEPFISSVHAEDQINLLRQAGENNRMLAEVATDSDTFPAAQKSIALAQYAAKHNDFSAGRPPGHHANETTSKGFCFFNNIAIVTKNLINEGKKVCIIDFDGHQGDGTEEIFYEDGNVLFLSIHQEFAYPYLYLGYRTDKGYDVTVDRHGKGDGDGLIYNVPVPKSAGDDILTEILEKFNPIIKSFSPDTIGVSAGFDGYMDDSLLDLNYSKHGFYSAGKIISSLHIPTFALLEGGYHHEVVDCIQCFAAGINDDEYPADQNPTESAEELDDRFQEYLEKSGIV